MKITKASVEDIAKQVQSAVTNEYITRKRVECIEELLGRNLRGKLKWLFLGK